MLKESDRARDARIAAGVDARTPSRGDMLCPAAMGGGGEHGQRHPFIRAARRSGREASRARSDGRLRPEAARGIRHARHREPQRRRRAGARHRRPFDRACDARLRRRDEIFARRAAEAPRPPAHNRGDPADARRHDPLLVGPRCRRRAMALAGTDRRREVPVPLHAVAGDPGADVDAVPGHARRSHDVRGDDSRPPASARRHERRESDGEEPGRDLPLPHAAADSLVPPGARRRGPRISLVRPHCGVYAETE